MQRNWGGEAHRITAGAQAQCARMGNQGSNSEQTEGEDPRTQPESEEGSAQPVGNSPVLDLGMWTGELWGAMVLNLLFPRESWNELVP